jgi:hypothetical protein
VKDKFLAILTIIILAFQTTCIGKVESAKTEMPFSPKISKETPTPETFDFRYEKIDVSQKTTQL